MNLIPSSPPSHPRTKKSIHPPSWPAQQHNISAVPTHSARNVRDKAGVGVARSVSTCRCHKTECRPLKRAAALLTGRSVPSFVSKAPVPDIHISWRWQELRQRSDSSNPRLKNVADVIEPVEPVDPDEGVLYRRHAAYLARCNTAFARRTRPRKRSHARFIRSAATPLVMLTTTYLPGASGWREHPRDSTAPSASRTLWASPGLWWPLARDPGYGCCAAATADAGVSSWFLERLGTSSADLMGWWGACLTSGCLVGGRYFSSFGPRFRGESAGYHKAVEAVVGVE